MPETEPPRTATARDRLMFLVNCMSAKEKGALNALAGLVPEERCDEALRLLAQIAIQDEESRRVFLRSLHSVKLVVEPTAEEIDEFSRMANGAALGEQSVPLESLKAMMRGWRE